MEATGDSVELVRRMYRAWNDGDWAAASELAHPDLEWVPDSRVGEGPIRGRERVVRFFRDRAEMFDEFRVELERVEARGEKVLALVHVTGHGHASGAGFDIRIGHVWTIRDGLAVRGEGYGERDMALAATGLDRDA